MAVEGSVTISKIYKQVANKKARYKPSPFYVELEPGARRRSIRLVPRRDGTQLEETVSTLVFQLSFRNDLDDRIMSDLVEWLAYDAPHAVQGLKVERIESMISATRHAYDVMSVNTTGRSHRDVCEPPNPFGRELLRGWDRLVGYVSGHRAIQRYNYGADDGSNPENAVGILTRTSYIQCFERHLSSLRDIIERRMLAQPENTDPSLLQTQITNPYVPVTIDNEVGRSISRLSNLRAEK